MQIHFAPAHFLHYFLKREATQFFTSIAIRNLALGMVLIFEPIYIWLFFEKSLPLSMLFFGASYGMYGVLAVFGAKIMSKIGSKYSMLLSHIFFFSYYLCLFFINSSYLLIPLAIASRAIGMTLFWPSFHVDFCRFSEHNHQGREVGKLNIVYFAPVIISPVIGGWILTAFGYPVLFTTVILIFLASSIPMFLSREVHVVYTDSLRDAWGRILKKQNTTTNFGFIFSALESGVGVHIWPIFMAILAISYSYMGGIVTFSLIISAFFMLYMGRASDRLIDRIRWLNIGSALTSIAWVLKFFVATPFAAFLSDALYNIFRTAASIPFQALMYEKASLKGAEMDEFIVYREIVINIAQLFFFMALAGLFFFFPQANLAFLIAACFALGFMFLGVPPKMVRRWIGRK
ncbi:MAG: MFS transporter [Candidatus Nealsonbacteria bacterium]|nr:MFS transporter [Candidatus Nealsonbacteria bacterium]